MTLDIIVCHNQPERIRSSMHFIDEVMEELAIPTTEYKVTRVPEHILDEPSSFPKQAIVYVHGNFYNKYENVGKARTLAQQRPDLKIIINVDGFKLREEHFENQADRNYIKELLEKDFNPQQQVVLSTTCPPEFFNPDSESNQSFRYYIQELRRKS